MLLNLSHSAFKNRKFGGETPLLKRFDTHKKSPKPVNSCFSSKMAVTCAKYVPSTEH